MAAGQFCRSGLDRRSDGPGVLQRHREQPGALMRGAPGTCPRQTCPGWTCPTNDSTAAPTMAPRPPTGCDDDATPHPPPACPCPRLGAGAGSGPPALAQSADPFARPRRPRRRRPPTTAAPGAFTVSDIRVDGLQRISAGTVFTYLPVERGDTVDSTKCRRGDPRAVQDRLLRGRPSGSPGRHPGRHRAVERPAINKLSSTGNKDIKTEDLMQGPEGNRPGRRRDLRPPGPRPRDPGTDPPVQQPRQVQRRDHPDRVAPGPQPRRRHDHDQGRQGREDPAHQPGRQREVRRRGHPRQLGIGASTTGCRWYRRDDQYSREKLSGDLEKLNNYYLDRGYVDFNVDSTQVAISPDRRTCSSPPA